ncbi:MAG TPA: hypothetical protein PL018_12300 [Ignavibacteriaceae bacterium]|nr:hypothetical protein [Ignavibacteriaceae bacterium]
MKKQSKEEKEKQNLLSDFYKSIPKDFPNPEKIKNIEKFKLGEILSIISYLKPLVGEDMNLYLETEAELKKGLKTVSIESVRIFKEAYHTSLAKLMAYEIEARKRLFSKEEIELQEKIKTTLEVKDDYESVIKLKEEFTQTTDKDLFKRIAEKKGKKASTVKSNYYYYLNNTLTQK